MVKVSLISTPCHLWAINRHGARSTSDDSPSTNRHLIICNGIFINALLIVTPEESQNILQTAVDTYGKLDILMQVASILSDRKDGHV